ncbi:MAG: SDR family oxidoreductase [Candidatus Cloacimonetes bacterium]|nr:SDR family oxidoreductase [Candidatus Cloacimonadota bacterium]
MRLKNKNIILTGAGRGIGKLIARKLDSEGARLALIARTEEELKKTLHQLKNNESFYKICDIANGESVINTFSDISRKFNDKIDVLINNAGVQNPIGPFIENDLDDWEKNLKINLLGSINCIKFILPYMIKSKHGKIVNFSGGGSTSPRPNFSAYSVSKTAIVRFTETLAEEIKEYNIDINAVAPGAINTSMLEEIIQSGKMAGHEFNEAMKREKSGGNDPKHIVELITFLSTNISDGITGKLISAIWDPWKDSEYQNTLRSDSNIATLRRIDNKYFAGIK